MNRRNTGRTRARYHMALVLEPILRTSMIGMSKAMDELWGRNSLCGRTLHELYLWPFAEGVKAGVGAVMTSYNEVPATSIGVCQCPLIGFQVNSSAASQNSMLMNGLLKDELGFQGFVRLAYGFRA